MKSWRLKLPPKFQRQVENSNTTSVFHHFTVYLHLQFEGFLILLIIVKGEVLRIYLIYIIPHRNILYTTVLNALQFYIISTSVFVRRKDVCESYQLNRESFTFYAFHTKHCLRKPVKRFMTLHSFFRFCYSSKFVLFYYEQKQFLFCMIEVTDSTQQIYDCLLTIAYTRKICLRI